MSTLQCGIVGLPNVGKSTLFNALSNAGIEAANYPFCTIEPNVGMVNVPDVRMDQLVELVQPERNIPTHVRFTDIAGLVSGASTGEGLGNKFLGHIRETQAILHVVRCHQDDDVIHVQGRVNPLDDIQTIETELALADLECIEKQLTKLKKQTKTGDPNAQALLNQLSMLHTTLQTQPLRRASLDSELIEYAHQLNLITIKPVLYVANIDEQPSQLAQQHLLEIEHYAHAESSEVISICAKIESEISTLDPEDKALFLADLGLEEPGLNRVIRSAYQLLKLRTFFTAGPQEVRAWTIQAGQPADQAAGVIHTDFQKGFIRAEVISYDDFITHEGERGAKEAGLWRLEGRDYIVQDGDIIYFRFNV
ncbi:MAG: redox-regulated ATPase YchF [Legionellales bacterium]|nr:redox-regulated ATPase YchF [Legionellales bacterium]|tara:strand:- start:10 stop:1104 length:1095 start_codon:yes stop_codon:yes gene_type:complete